MEFYQLKITRKGTKPPIWRRCLIPADINFEKLAEMLQDILEYQSTDLYEIEFFQKKEMVSPLKHIKKVSYHLAGLSYIFKTTYMLTFP